MMLITKEIRTKLLANHKATMAAEGADLDHKPVVKLFNPVGAGTWLLRNGRKWYRFWSL